ncbi:MAG TPA: YbhB/YbcL family Raf kinase inhibitor-like protein [Micromonosporaceae bacterium]|nr:YbhB/YbcL family Raf kinase inhibitor-like protein [Micromonosporaceae bacterium]
MANLQLRSSAFNDNDLMPERLSRLGGNTSPPLTWSAPPEGTAELVLLVEDPDAATPPFLHWLVTGIDPRASEVSEGQVPAHGREAMNDFGTVGWGGPQPPKGDNPHRYFFRLYAVDKPLQLPERVSTAEVHRAVEGHELASGTLIGTFAR